MCGRTAVNFGEDELRAELARANVNVNQIRNQPVWRRTHNVAPTYIQPVIRQLGDRNDPAPDRQPPPDTESSIDPPTSSQSKETSKPGDLIVQSMKWGLIPFWTKRQPDYSFISRTINCRDDSLFENRGMWNSIKGRKRCIIPVMGYYEWLKKSPKEKIPHFTKRADGKIMLLAGLWDSVQFEGTMHATLELMKGTDERIYTYTIITTSAAKSVSFLHDRMPVILEPDSDEMRKWLDPNEGWSEELAKMLKPYEGKLTCYPVKKEVGKVGEDSPLFVVPIDSAENKSNIANFFSKPASPLKAKNSKQMLDEQAVDKNAEDDMNSETHAPGKRKIEEIAADAEEDVPEAKGAVVEDGVKGQSPVKTLQRKPTKRTPQSAKKSPMKKDAGTKITNFFAVK